MASPVSGDRVASTGTVSGNQTNIPARIYQELDIGDGDKRRWHIEVDGTLRVLVCQQQGATINDFDGTRVMS